MQQNQRFNPFNNIVGPTLAPNAPTLNSSLYRKFLNAFVSFAGIPSLPKKNQIAPGKNPRLSLFKDRLHAIFLGRKNQFGMLDYATGMLDWGLLFIRDILSSVMDKNQGLTSNRVPLKVKVALFIPVILPIQFIRLVLTASQIILRAATYTVSFAIIAATSLVTLAVHAVSSLAKNILLKRASKLNINIADAEVAVNTDLETYLQSKGQSIKRAAPLAVALANRENVDIESSYSFIIKHSAEQPEYQSRPINYSDIKNPAKDNVDAKAVAALVTLDYQDIAKGMDALLRKPGKN